MVSHHLWRTKPGMRQNEHILCTATNASQPARQEGAFDVSIIRTCPPHGWSLPFNNNKHRQSSRVRTFCVRWNRGPSPDSFVCICTEIITIPLKPKLPSESQETSWLCMLICHGPHGPRTSALTLSTACTDGELATCVGHTSVLTTKHAN